MKKFVYVLLIIICLFGFTWTVNAQETQKEYQITWQDGNVKLEGFKWNVFMRDENTSYDENVPVLVIPLSDATIVDLEYKAVGSIDITGLPGSKVKKYFAMQSQLGTEKSILSEEAMVEFTIPLKAPYGVKIIFNISGE